MYSDEITVDVQLVTKIRVRCPSDQTKYGVAIVHNTPLLPDKIDAIAKIITGAPEYRILEGSRYKQIDLDYLFTERR